MNELVPSGNFEEWLLPLWADQEGYEAEKQNLFR